MLLDFLRNGKYKNTVEKKYLVSNNRFKIYKDAGKSEYHRWEEILLKILKSKKLKKFRINQEKILKPDKLPGNEIITSYLSSKQNLL